MPSVCDVGPDVELGPVRQREHADALAREDPAVVEVPDLGPLVLGVPLAELVAEREHALLGARLLLVAPRRRRTARRSRCFSAASSSTGVWIRLREPLGSSLHQAALDRVLDRGDDQLQAELLDPAVAVGEDLREVEAGVDVHHRERDPRRGERLAREVEHHDRVLAAREQQARALHLGGDLAEDVDALGLQGAELGQDLWGAHRGAPCGASAGSTPPSSSDGGGRRAPGGTRPGRATTGRAGCRRAASRRAGSRRARRRGRPRPGPPSPTRTGRRRGRRRRRCRRRRRRP